MTFELARALRRIKPQRRSPPLTRRPDRDLPFVGEPLSAGPELMLDTCVYIDVLQGRTPDPVDALLMTRASHHSAVCLSELTHLFGRLDPAHAGTRRVLRELEGVIDDLPHHRLTAPSVHALGGAGMLAGLVTRLAGVASGREQALLNDAILYMHALERGCAVLTRNVREFDFFDQLMPNGRALFYRQV